MINFLDDKTQHSDLQKSNLRSMLITLGIFPISDILKWALIGVAVVVVAACAVVTVICMNR